MNATKEWLSDGEKSLIAMGAAMGAGCRTCAENLERIARDQNLSQKDIRTALLKGLEGKAEAVQTMRDKVRALVGDDGEAGDSIVDRDSRLAALIRLAAFIAANSAPDACREIGISKAAGVTEREMKLCQSIARMVREHAMEFSDQEVGQKLSVGPTVEEESKNPLGIVCARNSACCG